MMQEVSQQIEETARSVVNEVHTALPGNVISYNPAGGTATVKPEGKYETNTGEKLAYPTISDVPVVFPCCQSGSVGIAFPISKGDSCLIIISEVELDEWRSGAESEASLRFDLSNAMCIPGLLDGGGELAQKAASQNAVIVSTGDSEVVVSSSSVSVTAGDKKLAVSDSGVSITGNLTVDGNVTATGSIG